MRALILAATLGMLGVGNAWAADDVAGDADSGKNVFKKCAACHAVGEGATNRVGPVLNDLFGRVAGTYPNYKYSQAMVDAGASGLVWTPKTFAPYIHKPKDIVPGTKMTFGGLQDQTDVQNLIAYLLTLSPDYVPTPEEGDATTDAASSAATP